MDARREIRPSRITPTDERLPPLELIRTVVKNPMQVWPASIYREPIVRWRALRQEMVFVNAPELIHEVLLEQADAFDKGALMRRALMPALGEAILTADGARWRWQRRAAAPIFRQDVVLGFVPIMVAAAERTRDRWLSAPPGTELNISHEMMRTTFDVILDTMLSGRATMDVARIEDAITHFLESIGWITALALFRAPRWVPYPGYLKARRARDYLRATLAKVVADCRARHAGANDLVTRLMAASDPETGQAMNDHDLADNLLTFITAGHETTAVALSWTFYLLSLDPAAEERIVGEIETVTGGEPIRAEHIDRLVYTRQVFLESMRLYPPVPVLARTPTRDVRIGTDSIPKGMPVYIPIYAVHRHVMLWDDPDRFDPERFAPNAAKARHRYAYIPFGAGPRICIGMSFAMTEAVAMLATLLRAVHLRMRPGYVPALKMRATLRAAEGMPMSAERR